MEKLVKCIALIGVRIGGKRYPAGELLELTQLQAASLEGYVEIVAKTKPETVKDAAKTVKTDQDKSTDTE